MNDTPIRWRDDPQFRSSSGIDLRAADEGVGPFDLDRVRAKAFQAPPGLGWTPGVGVAVLAVGVGAAAWLAASEANVPPPLAVESPPAHSVAVVTPVAPPFPPHQVTAVLEVPAASPRSVPVVEAVAAPAELPPPPIAVDEVSTPVDVPRPVLDGLAAQMAEYDRARGLERVGHREAALGAYEAWLERWPDGRLGTEVQLARVQLLMALGRAVEAEVAAARVIPTVDAEGVRRQLSSLRAEALSALDRCDEALLLVDALSDEDAAAVRKRCRRR